MNNINALLQAEEEKKLGNVQFREKNYQQALIHYSKAIELDPKNSVLFGNKAQTLLQMGKYSEALEDANKSLSLDNKWYKAYYRKAKLLELSDRYQEALTVCRMGLRNCKRVDDEDGKKILKALKEEVKKSLYSQPKNEIDILTDSISALTLNERADKLFKVCEVSFIMPKSYSSFNWIKVYGCLNEKNFLKQSNDLFNECVSKCKTNQPIKEETEAITLMLCNKECFSRKIMIVTNLDQLFVACFSYIEGLSDENLNHLLIMFGNIFLLMDPITRQRIEASEKVKQLLNDIMFVRNKSKEYFSTSALGFRLFYCLFQNKYWRVIKQLKDFHIGKLCNVFLRTIKYSEDEILRNSGCYLLDQILSTVDEIDTDKGVLFTYKGLSIVPDVIKMIDSHLKKYGPNTLEANIIADYNNYFQLLLDISIDFGGKVYELGVTDICLPFISLESDDEVLGKAMRLLSWSLKNQTGTFRNMLQNKYQILEKIYPIFNNYKSESLLVTNTCMDIFNNCFIFQSFQSRMSFEKAKEIAFTCIANLQFRLKPPVKTMTEEEEGLVKYSAGLMMYLGNIKNSENKSILHYFLDRTKGGFLYFIEIANIGQPYVLSNLTGFISAILVTNPHLVTDPHIGNSLTFVRYLNWAQEIVKARDPYLSPNCLNLLSVFAAIMENETLPTFMTPSKPDTEVDINRERIEFDKERCNCCGKKDKKKNLFCGYCKKVRYCGKDCQSIDWPIHKHNCK